MDAQATASCGVAACAAKCASRNAVVAKRTLAIQAKLGLQGLLRRLHRPVRLAGMLREEHPQKRVERAQDSISKGAEIAMSKRRESSERAPTSPPRKKGS
eukprot:6180267-Pleurochrysis_carterae.AAC.2